jgi:hypothetical protein
MAKMRKTPDRADLCRCWVHSHEEDSAGAQVFRPADHAFPPSRGRRRLDLRPDGSLLETHAGADDRAVSAQGRWRLAGRRLRLSAGSGADARELEVVALEPDRLVVRRAAARS